MTYSQQQQQAMAQLPRGGGQQTGQLRGIRELLDHIGVLCVDELHADQTGDADVLAGVNEGGAVQLKHVCVGLLNLWWENTRRERRSGRKV